MSRRLAEHVGRHRVDFTATDGEVSDTESVDIEVLPGGAAPRFVQPPHGGTYDLGSSPCVDVDIQVVDEDDMRVDIYERDPRIEGAQLTQPDNFSAQWYWCPTAPQIAAYLHYTLHLEVNDGHSPPVFQDYEIELIAP
jgi:hypothetical protein